MENASKALIIAAAVLVAVLLITLAIKITTSASEIANSESSLSEVEAKAFNQKFTPYEGKRKSQSDVLVLLKTVASSNSVSDNKVAVKLHNMGSPSVYDSCRYLIKDDNTGAAIRGPSCNVVSLEEIIDVVKKSPFTYKVTLYYCTKSNQSLANNRDLNPAIGHVLLVDIEKN